MCIRDRVSVIPGRISENLCVIEGVISVLLGLLFISFVKLRLTQTPKSFFQFLYHSVVGRPSAEEVVLAVFYALKN